MSRSALRSFVGSVLALALALALTACGGAVPEDSAPATGSGKADSLFPNTGEPVGQLSFLSHNVPADTRIYLDGESVSPVDATTLTAGDHEVALREGGEGRIVTVKPGEKTTVELWGVVPRSRGPFRLGPYEPDLGPNVSLALYNGDLQLGVVKQTVDRFVSFRNVVGCGYLAEGAQKPGYVVEQVASSTGDVFPKAPSDIARGSFQYQPTVKTFPDYNPGERWISTGGDSPDVLATRTLDERLLVARNSPRKYAELANGLLFLSGVVQQILPTPYLLWVNGTYVFVSIPESYSSVELPVRRLNVDHVHDVQDDGSKLKVPGDFSVEWRQPSGDYVALPTAQSVPTQHGVDLVPGHYRVTVRHTPTGSSTLEPHIYEVDL